MHKVLVLGAGLVSHPIIRYFLDNDGFDLTVGTLYIEDARALIGDRTDALAVSVDVGDGIAAGFEHVRGVDIDGTQAEIGLTRASA